MLSQKTLGYQFKIMEKPKYKLWTMEQEYLNNNSKILQKYLGYLVQKGATSKITQF